MRCLGRYVAAPPSARGVAGGGGGAADSGGAGEMSREEMAVSDKIGPRPSAEVCRQTRLLATAG